MVNEVGVGKLATDRNVEGEIRTDSQIPRSTEQDRKTRTNVQREEEAALACNIQVPQEKNSEPGRLTRP